MSIVESIRPVVGDTGILVGEDVLQRPNASKGRGQCQALAIVRPASTDELSSVMRICFEANQTVVPLGGLTGTVDGIECSDTDIGISLERMRDIESIDVDAGTMVVQAGAIIQTVQEKARDAGWLFGVDWGARGTANIGGMVSTNAGGNNVVRYGMARDNILGLEAVLADGTVISSMNQMLKNNAGYDLKQLFIGTEGTLGIVTRAVLRLRPLPSVTNTAFLAVETFDHVIKLLRHFGRVFEGKLSAFEVMWNNHYRYLTDDTGKHQPILPTHYPFYILMEVEGADAGREADYFMTTLSDLMEQGDVADAVICQSSQQAAQIWALRDDVATLARNMRPMMAFDISLRLKDMEAYVEGVLSDVASNMPDTKIVSFGHLGDGNIHFIAGPVNDRRQLENIVYGRVKTYGGSVSAEHGIGLEKKDFLSFSRSDAEIKMMKTIKQALDPKGLLNRNKIFS